MDCTARSRVPVPKSLCAVADENCGARICSMEKMRVQLNGISRLRLWGALSFGLLASGIRTALRKTIKRYLDSTTILCSVVAAAARIHSACALATLITYPDGNSPAVLYQHECLEEVCAVDDITRRCAPVLCLLLRPYENRGACKI